MLFANANFKRRQVRIWENHALGGHSQILNIHTLRGSVSLCFSIPMSKLKIKKVSFSYSFTLRLPTEKILDDC